jgi:hypothetical protein
MQILLRSNVVDPTKAKARKERSRAVAKGDTVSASSAPSVHAHLSEGGLRNTKAPVAPATPMADIQVDVRGEPDRLLSQAGDIEMGRVQQDGSHHGSSTDDAPLLLQQVNPHSVCKYMVAHSCIKRAPFAYFNFNFGHAMHLNGAHHFLAGTVCLRWVYLIVNCCSGGMCRMEPLQHPCLQRQCPWPAPS